MSISPERADVVGAREIVNPVPIVVRELYPPSSTSKPLGEQTERAQVIADLAWVELDAFAAPLENSIRDVRDLANPSMDAIKFVRQKQSCFDLNCLD